MPAPQNTDNQIKASTLNNFINYPMALAETTWHEIMLLPQRWSNCSEFHQSAHSLKHLLITCVVVPKSPPVTSLEEKCDPHTYSNVAHMRIQARRMCRLKPILPNLSTLINWSLKNHRDLGKHSTCPPKSVGECTNRSISWDDDHSTDCVWIGLLTINICITNSTFWKWTWATRRIKGGICEYVIPYNCCCIRWRAYRLLMQATGRWEPSVKVTLRAVHVGLKP